jgi:leucyl-tRNA synthetase
VLAPESLLVARITTEAQREAVTEYQRVTAARSEKDRQANKQKTGVNTGAFAINPVNGAKVPVWIADYVIAGYGTGAIMAVPGHDERDWEFARTFGLPILEVVAGGDVTRAAYTGDGVMVNSAHFDGTPTANLHAVRAVTSWLSERSLGHTAITYKLRDWVFARQRYWGEPIPVLKKNGAVVRALDLEELPLVLPTVSDYKPGGEGGAPLARARGWSHVHDAAHGETLEREIDTMPGSAGSSWYFLRYCDPHNEREFCARDKSDYWMPVDLYVGGPEHAVGHLLFARMWQRVLCDLGAVRDAEPFAKLRHQGMILGETFYEPDAYREHGDKAPNVPRENVEERDGRYVRKSDGAELLKRVEKMSKRKGNVINPDEVVREHGADALRVYICFMGPLEADKPWQTNGLEGQTGFLRRTWRLYFEGDNDLSRVTDDAASEAELKVLHKTIKKVTHDIESLDLNTAISALHVAVRDLTGLGTRARAVLAPLAQLFAPFAPHLAEELWVRALGHAATPGGVGYAPWPSYEERYTVDDTLAIGVQVNGKTVGSIELPQNAPEEVAVEAAKASLSIARHLEGKVITKVIYRVGRILNLVVR